MVFNNTDRIIKMNEGVEARGFTIMEPQQHKLASAAGNASAAKGPQ